ncbi:MAG TPA: trypsin-like peptidase domain-containing protein [Acidimicrobiia bacterium]|nr:trypsin-like peptidase domain-containing protein [Acidimicrobiia bacterium]
MADMPSPMWSDTTLPPETPGPDAPLPPESPGRPAEPASGDRGPAFQWGPPVPPPAAPPTEPPSFPSDPASEPPAPPAARPSLPWVEAAGPGRRFLAGVVVGALVGALVAGGIVARSHHNATASPAVNSKAVAAARASLLAHPGDVHQIVQAVGPSVVSIQTQAMGVGAFLQAVPQEGAGSGFVLSPDGVIVTNNHVVAGASTITVTLADGRKLAGRVLGRDATADLAVLKVDASGLPAVKIGSSSALVVGDSVVAIGNALALDGGPTVTEGIVSALDRTISAGDQGSTGTSETLRHVLQTDAAINPGNSGGPLLNAAGEVVGINTAVAGDAQNIGFALAIDKAMPIINQLKTGQTPQQPFLGVATVTLTPGIQRQLGLDVGKGAVVASVTPGSGADQAGLAQGDVITAIGGKDVSSADDVTAAVSDRKPGDTIDITIDRNGATRTVTAKIGSRSGAGG